MGRHGSRWTGRVSGNTGFHEAFASIDTAPLQALEGAYELRIYVDHCSVEIFAQDGQVTMTELIFPDPDSVSVTAYASGGTATLTSLTAMTRVVLSRPNGGTPSAARISSA